MTSHGVTAPPDAPEAPEAHGLAADQYRATVAAAMDAIVVIDSTGRVLEWNRAAERLFGFPAADTIGRELASLIVPPESREPHREGLATAVAGVRGEFLGRHVEVTGQRADGSRVPIELTITRIGTDRAGAPLFSGFLRDITQRQQLTADLRASRSRVVKVSDETRRRVERDLHDGAQQQLVAVAIKLGQLSTLVEHNDPLALTVLEETRGHLADALSELRELARGIHPESLRQRGLPGAVRELARRSPIPVRVEANITRFETDVENALYFVVSEAITNAAKHGAMEASLRMWWDQSPPHPVLRCTLTDNGPGGADPARGSGLTGLQDRVAALGGEMSVRDGPSGGTYLSVFVPALPVPS